MLLRVFLGALVGAVILFAWGFVFWAVLPTSQAAVQTAADERGLAEALKEALPADGTYYIPAEGSETQSEEWTANHKAGPLAMIFYRQAGANPMDPKVFGMGFAHMFFSALLMGLLVANASSSLESYVERVGFITMAGLFAAVYVDFSSPIWWWHPWNYHLYAALGHGSSWLLAGLGMAAVVKES